HIRHEPQSSDCLNSSFLNPRINFYYCLFILESNCKVNAKSDSLQIIKAEKRENRYIFLL
ncbi:hypothetical protein, partial [Prevotella dentalis]|uniref:hypothetical protein n=1 Tax=Prevotella dentalis TaxID=52227 RepID=UPI001C54CD6F